MVVKIWLLALLVFCGSFGLSQKLVSDSECQPCIGKTAHGPFVELAKGISSYSLPTIARDTPIREEPWVYVVTVDTTGHLCGVVLRTGPEGAVDKAIRKSLQSWTFSPFVAHNGKVYCVESKMMVYVRSVSRRPAILVPGLNGIQ
jgi:hypothetical protein